MDVNTLPEVPKDAKLKAWFIQTLEVCGLTKELTTKWCFVAETKRSPDWCSVGSQDWSLEPWDQVFKEVEGVGRFGVTAHW